MYVSFAIYDKNFRDKFGVTDKQVRLWRKDPLNSIEDIKLRYHLTIPGKIIDVRRNIRDIKNLVDKVNDVRYAEVYKRFTPEEGFHCNMCEYQKRCESDRTSKSPLDIDQLPLLIRPSPLEINVENLVLSL